MLLRKWSITLLLAVAAGLAYLWTPVMAADPAFVGILALIADGDVATQIGLTEDERSKLIEFIKKREDEAETLVLSSRTLPPEEKAAKVKAFLDESEKQGFALLTAEQRTKLQQVRLERAGLSTLAEAPIADSLKLTDAQKAEVKKLLEQRASDLGRGNERERQLAKARSERALVKLLSKEQRTAWEELAGKTGILPSPGDEPSDEPAPPGEEPAVATTGKPGETVATKPAGDGTLKFNFRFQPWKDVLDWFAKQSGMSLVAESMPPGTFNYVDNRAYTPSESIDLLNGILVTKGYLLLRRERMLILFNLEDEIPDLLIDTVSPEQLDGRGRYELMTCLFPVKRITPEDAEKEVNKLRGPFGKVVVLPQVKQLQVRELGGKLRAIRDMLASVENPESNPKEKTTIIRLEHISTDEFMFALRPILGMPENVNSMPDGSLRLAPDPLNGRIFATGKAERLEKLDELLKLLDVESAKAAAPAGGAVEQAQIEVYPPGGADPIAILQVMQTLIGALPDVRMATDPKTGNLVVLARPSQHATIRETLKQLQKDVSNIEVFQLRRVDPQLATVTINKLFGGDEKGAGAGGPKVESDPTTRLLIVRGAPAQIAQVRSLLEKMGEGENLTTSASETPAADRGNVRTIPLGGREAERVLTQLEAIWPTVRSNRIRVVRPSARGAEESTEEGATKRDDEGRSGADSRGLRSQRLDSVSREPKPKPVTRETTTSEDPENRPAGENPNVPNPAVPNPGAPVPAPNQPATVPPGKSAGFGGAKAGRMQFVAFQTPAAGADEPAADAKAPRTAKAPANSKPADEKAPASEKPASEKVPADVVITIQKGGIVIASEDKQALDDLEALFSTLAGREAMSGTTREYTVYYLRHSKAEAAAALLNTIIAGGGESSGAGGGGGGGSLLGDLASGMMGDMAGGLLGGLLGGGGAGGGAAASGPVTITPDARLNALIVKAAPSDLELVEELLKVIDQEASPEPDETAGKPRFIPVNHTSAEEVAGIVRTVFANRIVADSSQPRQPSPEDLVRALRGGRGGGGSSQAKSEPTKMTLGVDARSNSLIVSAPEPLYLEVKALVTSLDLAANNTRDEALKVVTVKAANPLVLQRALQSMGGPSVQVNSNMATTPGMRGGVGGFNQPNGIAPVGGRPQGQQQQNDPANMMRQLDAMQRAAGGNRGGTGGVQGFPGGGSSRGGASGGFPGMGGGGFPGMGGGGFPGMGSGGRGGRGR